MFRFGDRVVQLVSLSEAFVALKSRRAPLEKRPTAGRSRLPAARPTIGDHYEALSSLPGSAGPRYGYFCSSSIAFSSLSTQARDGHGRSLRSHVDPPGGRGDSP